MTPVLSPAFWASRIPTPSLESNILASFPPEKKMILPSVRTPSASIRTIFTRRARSVRSCACFTSLSLEQLETPEVVDLHETFEAHRLVDDRNRCDLALLHQPKRDRGQVRACDRHGLLRHHVAREAR